MSLLIIKSSRYLRREEYAAAYDNLLKQKNHGLVILQPGYEAIYVPDDVEIKLEDENVERSEC